jgi:hypothetical protein
VRHLCDRELTSTETHARNHYRNHLIPKRRAEHNATNCADLTPTPRHPTSNRHPLVSGAGTGLEPSKRVTWVRLGKRGGRP